MSTVMFALHCSCWQETPSGSLILLHAYAHNSTILDPAKGQWLTILDAISAAQDCIALPIQNTVVLHHMICIAMQILSVRVLND